MNGVQEELLKLLKAFQEICKENNLRYYASGGTLLGAVRHHGFIPWDDDIDLFMPREDYDRLVCRKKVRIPERFEVKELDGIGHFADKTVQITHGNKYWDTRYPNLSIDLFPLDGTPNNRFCRYLHITHCLVYFAIFKFKNIEFAMNTEKQKNRQQRSRIECFLIEHGKFFNIIVSWIDEKKLEERFAKLQRKYKYNNSRIVGVFCGRHRYKEFFEKSEIGKGKRLRFEDTSINVFRFPKYWLIRVYGDRYMEMPKEEKREQHGDLRII